MATLHIAPSDTAGGSLRCAIREAGSDDDVLSFRDDLSCGPIASGSSAERARWWAPFHSDTDIEAELTAFWDRVSAAEDRLVVWFGRHRASEYAFSLAWAHRLGARPYEFIDVTGVRVPITRKDGSLGLSRPIDSVGLMNPAMLRSLFGSERAATPEERERSRRTWDQLKAENAPFRVVTATGLKSAPDTYFDEPLIERATADWKPLARLIAEAMVYTDEPYMQVGDVMLQSRAVVLIEQGKLLADGGPWDGRACRVRLPA